MESGRKPLTINLPPQFDLLFQQQAEKLLESANLVRLAILPDAQSFHLSYRQAKALPKLKNLLAEELNNKEDLRILSEKYKHYLSTRNWQGHKLQNKLVSFGKQLQEIAIKDIFSGDSEKKQTEDTAIIEKVQKQKKILLSQIIEYENTQNLTQSQAELFYKITRTRLKSLGDVNNFIDLCLTLNNAENLKKISHGKELSKSLHDNIDKIKKIDNSVKNLLHIESKYLLNLAKIFNHLIGQEKEAIETDNAKISRPELKTKHIDDVRSGRDYHVKGVGRAKNELAQVLGDVARPSDNVKNLMRDIDAVLEKLLHVLVCIKDSVEERTEPSKPDVFLKEKVTEFHLISSELYHLLGKRQEDFNHFLSITNSMMHSFSALHQQINSSDLLLLDNGSLKIQPEMNKIKEIKKSFKDFLCHLKKSLSANNQNLIKNIQVEIDAVLSAYDDIKNLLPSAALLQDKNAISNINAKFKIILERFSSAIKLLESEIDALSHHDTPTLATLQPADLLSDQDKHILDILCGFYHEISSKDVLSNVNSFKVLIEKLPTDKKKADDFVREIEEILEIGSLRSKNSNEAKIAILKAYNLEIRKRKIAQKIANIKNNTKLVGDQLTKKIRELLFSAILEEFFEDLKTEEKVLFWHFTLSVIDNHDITLSGSKLRDNKVKWYKDCYADVGVGSNEDAHDQLKLDSLIRGLNSIELQELTSQSFKEQLAYILKAYQDNFELTAVQNDALGKLHVDASYKKVAIDEWKRKKFAALCINLNKQIDFIDTLFEKNKDEVSNVDHPLSVLYQFICDQFKTVRELKEQALLDSRATSELIGKKQPDDTILQLNPSVNPAEKNNASHVVLNPLEMVIKKVELNVLLKEKMNFKLPIYIGLGVLFALTLTFIVLFSHGLALPAMIGLMVVHHASTATATMAGVGLVSGGATAVGSMLGVIAKKCVDEIQHWWRGFKLSLSSQTLQEEKSVSSPTKKASTASTMQGLAKNAPANRVSIRRSITLDSENEENSFGSFSPSGSIKNSTLFAKNDQPVASKSDKKDNNYKFCNII